MAFTVLFAAAAAWLCAGAEARHRHPAVNVILSYHREVTIWIKEVVVAFDLQDWFAVEDAATVQSAEWLNTVRDPGVAAPVTPRPLAHAAPLPVDTMHRNETDASVKFRPQLMGEDPDPLCAPGIAVYDSPKILCRGTPVTALDYVAQRQVNCQISGRKTCLCPKDSAFYLWETCGQVRPLTCTPTLVEPDLACPVNGPASPMGDPNCLGIDRRQTVTLKYRLKCAVTGEIQTEDPKGTRTAVSMGSLLGAAAAQLQTTPLLSADGTHYATPEWYRDQFDYPIRTADGALTLSGMVPGQMPTRMYLKIWDFVVLSDDSNKKYVPVTTAHVLGDELLTFEVEFAKVDDNFLVGGRAYLEAGFDTHRGSGRLLIDINNYLIRHKPLTYGQIWLGILVGGLSALMLSCCCMVGWKVWRQRKRREEKNLLNDSKQD